MESRVPPFSADHRPAGAGHTGVRLQAAVRLRRGGCGLPALVANQVAVAIENALAFQEIEAALQEIQALKDQLAKENAYLEEEVRTEHNFGEIVGGSATLHRS